MLFGDKYCMSKFASKEDMERSIMADVSLDDYEKLVMVFQMNKDEVRRCNVQLFYALLAVEDKFKLGYNNAL